MIEGLRNRRALQSLEVTSHTVRAPQNLGGILGGRLQFEARERWRGALERKGCLITNAIVWLCPERASEFVGRITDAKRLRDIASVS